MRLLITGFVLAVLLALGVYGGYVAYQDHKLVRAVSIYLLSETEVKGADGKALSRADLIDAILRDAISKAKK